MKVKVNLCKQRKWEEPMEKPGKPWCKILAYSINT